MPPVQWGITYEPVARLAYEEKAGVAVSPCGTRLHLSGVLGATPDGICPDGALVEIKCPYLGRDRDIRATMLQQAEEKEKNDGRKPKNTKLFFPFLLLDEDLKPCLNHKHPYYHQVSSNDIKMSGTVKRSLWLS